jgi:GDP/UDP-N,N'-diacetylbacillosamine 2-epimerase (hydrolysing)
MKRKICVITGTRAEYGLLRPLICEVSKDKQLQLQVVAAGMHMSPDFGMTYREIEQDGYRIDKKVEMLVASDTPIGIAKSIGLGTISFSEALSELLPDVVVVLGDRFEILAAASAALVLRIPVAHIHGGEATEGLIDEAIRHAITKMSHLHFTAAAIYRKRVIQLGEDPARVFNVGGMGVDCIRQLKLLKRAAVERRTGIRFRERNLMVTFHPVTLEAATAEKQFGELLSALSGLRDTALIFTKPNADTDGRVIASMIDAFVHQYSDSAFAFVSMGQLLYLSTLQYVDGVVGNSSSGLTEAPTFKIATINIGDRQTGRLRATSVLDCDPDETAIRRTIERMYSGGFQRTLRSVRNPYGDGGAAKQIVAVLRTADLENILKKKFYDIRFSP